MAQEMAEQQRVIDADIEEHDGTEWEAETVAELAVAEDEARELEERWREAKAALRRKQQYADALRLSLAHYRERHGTSPSPC